jgi:hypothetical protein
MQGGGEPVVGSKTPHGETLTGAIASLDLTRTVLLLALILAPEASAIDVVLSGGAGPPVTSTVGTPIGTTVSAESGGTIMLNFGGDVVNLKAVALGYEVPVAFGGPGRALVSARGSATYTERANFVATPGARLRILPAAKLTPWVSVGAGIGRLERNGALYFLSNHGEVAGAQQTGPRSVFVLSTAGGADWKLARHVVIRAELRNFTFTTPQTGFVGSFPFYGERRNNLLFLGGVGLHF